MKFLIIDGNAIVHRAYHALPSLTSPDGQIVNAIYGFFSMLLKVTQEVAPDYIAVCFDRPKPTFRKSLYAGYQAHRPKMDDDLSIQITRLHEALNDSHISIFEVDGYEADDLIGTLSTQASAQKDIETLIVTGDRDLLQLVNGKVQVLAPILGITKMTQFTSEKVKEKYGIKPFQIIDYKALVGDQSDGYPGVTGIGPKTASNLLTKFGTFENLYRHLSEVPPKIAEKLAADAEQASLAKKLATIITDAPVKFSPEKCSITNVTKEDLKNAFKKLGFNSLQKRLDSIKAIPSGLNNEQLGLL